MFPDKATATACFESGIYPEGRDTNEVCAGIMTSTNTDTIPFIRRRADEITCGVKHRLIVE